MITARMDFALHQLAGHWSGRRKPKAFYLDAADWDEFRAAADLACTVRVPFGNNPTIWRDEPAFRDVPVRQTTTAAAPSRLYDQTGTGRPLPQATETG